MDRGRFEGLVHGMASDGRIDSMTLGAMVRTFVGDCGEAYVAAAAATARVLAGGAVDLGGGSSATSLPTGSEHDLGMVLTHAGESYVAVVELAGKPDPDLDAVMDEVFADMGLPRAEGVVTPRPREIRVASAGRDRAATLAGLVADRWMPDLVFGSGISGRTWDDDDAASPAGEWLRGTRDLDDPCAWAGFFQVLDMAVVATGNEDALARDCDDMAGRRWAVQSGHPATVVGAALAADCGYRPGRRGAALVDAVQARACEMDLAGCRDMLSGLRDACSRHGHVGEDARLDLGTDAYAFTALESDAAWVLRLDTQSRDIAVAVAFDAGGGPVAVEVHQRSGDAGARGDGWGDDAFGMGAAPRARSVAPASLVASFEASGGGFRIVATPGNVLDRIRAWNGFEANVHNAHHCLEAEYGEAPAP